MNILSASVVLDIVFFAVLIVGLAVGCARGFVRGICKLAGTALSGIMAFFFCVPFAGGLESQFGLITQMASSIGPDAAYWITVVLSFILLAVLVKLGAWLIGKLASVLVDRFALFRIPDKILGGLLGIAEALLLIFLLLLVFRLLNIPAANEFIEGSMVLGKIYYGSWFDWVVSLPARILGK